MSETILFKSGDSLTWYAAQNLMFDFAHVLNAEHQEEFWGSLRDIRLNARNPEELLQVVLIKMKWFIARDAILKRIL